MYNFKNNLEIRDVVEVPIEFFRYVCIQNERKRFMNEK